MRFKRLTLAAAVAVFPFAAFAAETTLSPVVVQATKDGDQAAKAVSVSASDLQASRAATSDAASLLRDIPGVSLQGAGGISSLPSIHGLADDRLRIKVDGMDLIASCPNHMNPALSYLDPSNVGALKVYAGITPVSVGGDSIGGTIVAETPAPAFAAPGQGSLFKGEAGVFYRSNGHARGGNLSATYATESVSISYAGSMAESDNYQAGGKFKSYTGTGRAGHQLARDEVGSTAYETRNHTLGLAFRGGDHLVEARFGYQDQPYQLYPNQRMDMLDNEQKRLSLRYLGRFGWGALEARAYHEEVDHMMDFGPDKRFWYGTASNSGTNGVACSIIGMACAAGMPMYTEGKTSGVSVKAGIDIGQDDLLRIGGDWQRYRLDDWWPPSGGGMWPGTFWNIRDGERDRAAVFGEWEKQLTPRWTTLLGARYEHVRSDAGTVQGYNPNTNGSGSMMSYQMRDAAAFNASDRSKADNNWDFVALARHAHDANTDIEFGFARKVRSPNLYERYTWSTWGMAAIMNNTVGDGNGYIGNPDLDPEKAHTLSATLDWHAADRAWEFKATPYYTRVTDYIDAVQWNAATNAPQAALATNQFSVLRFANQSARLYGIDLSGKMPLAKTGFGEFGLKGLLIWTNGKNRDTGDDLYNIMPLNAKLTLTHRHGGWNNAVELAMVKGKHDTNAARNEIGTDGYSLIHLRGSYAWTTVRIDFGIENLFDRRYALPLGGAYTGQGRTMAGNPPASDGMFGWGTAVPGMGRSLYAGLNVKF